MDAVTNYFSEEKKESKFFAVIGLLACLLSVFCLGVSENSFLHGISYAFISIGAVQIVVGATIYLRSDIDTVRVNHYIERDQKSITDDEIPRMTLLIRDLLLYRQVEIVVSVLGLILFVSFSTKDITSGIGLGLAIQSSVMLFWDIMSEKRASEYLKYLNSLS